MFFHRKLRLGGSRRPHFCLRLECNIHHGLEREGKGFLTNKVKRAQTHRFNHRLRSAKSA